MPASSAISLNGTSFKPKSIDIDEERVGIEFQAVNGARRYAHRAIKRTWKIAWEGIQVAVVNQIRAVNALTTSFTYIDESAASFTVLCGPNALTVGTPTISGDGTIYYSASLTIKEA